MQGARKSFDNKKQSQGYVDLRKKTDVELHELLERQMKLLHNKSFISKLSDKGARILAFKSQIEEELKKRDTVNEATNLFSRVNLNGALEEVEWTGSSQPSSSKKTDRHLADDDDDDYNIDPLKLIATHSGTLNSKIKKETLVEPSLVTDKDIEEAKTFSSGIYAERVCNKYDKPGEPPDRFKLNQPKSKEDFKSAFRSSSENVQKKLGKNWEVTAATPPVPIHGDTKKISLLDSLELQAKQVQRLKDIQFKEAVARLQQTAGVKYGTSMPISDVMKYRNAQDPCNLFEGSTVRETRDEDNALEDEEEGGMNAVFYNIVDDVGEKS